MTDSPRGILWAVLVDHRYEVDKCSHLIDSCPPGLLFRHPHWLITDYDLLLLDLATQETVVVNKRFGLGEPHHVTLQYDVEKTTVDRLIGKRFIATLTELRQDDRAQAFRVVLPADIAPLWKGDTIPHLTVSYKEYPVHGGKAALDGEVTGSNPINVEFAIAFHQFQPKE